MQKSRNNITCAETLDSLQADKLRYKGLREFSSVLLSGTCNL